MRILIAGATGLIGSEVVRQCHNANINVHYLTTRSEKIENKPNYKGFLWNPAKNEIDGNAFDGVSVIINLAGASISKRWTKAYKKEILESRVNTADLMYRFLEKNEHQVSHYISASGVSIYPNSKTMLYFEDSEAIDTTFLAEVVIAWEAAADQFMSLGIDVAKLRTGVVLDSKEGALPQMAKPIRYNMGAPLGDGEQWLSWIHIKDIAAMYVFTVQAQLEGVYNAVSPNPVTNKKITQQIASKLNKPLWLPHVPSFMIKFLLGEMATLALDGQLVSSAKVQEQGFNFSYINVAHALDDLL